MSSRSKSIHSDFIKSHTDETIAKLEDKQRIAKSNGYSLSCKDQDILARYKRIQSESNVNNADEMSKPLRYDGYRKHKTYDSNYDDY